jgi:hypothetical protein
MRPINKIWNEYRASKYDYKVHSPDYDVSEIDGNAGLYSYSSSKDRKGITRKNRYVDRYSTWTDHWSFYVEKATRKD